MNEKKEKSSGKVAQKKVRTDKMKNLAEMGVDLFPHKIDVSHSVFEVVSLFSDSKPEDLEKEKNKVKVAGRIIAIREMGKAVFFHIKDSREKLQGYIRKDRVGEKTFEMFSLLDIGDIIAVHGEVFKTRTQELTVLLDSFDFLAKCLYPLPEKWHGLRDIELRYRKRHLDLIVNPEEMKVFRLRSRMITKIREFFNSKGYIEVETPMMQPIPGGALAKPFQTFHNALGIDLYLRIAPELYLKRLVVGGMEKVYEINRNFRNEGISSEHNPEFTMLEFYEAYCDYNDMMDITEELIHFLSMELKGKHEVMYGDQKICFQKPWERIKFMDALSKYSGLSPSRFDDQKGIIEFASDLSGEESSLTYGKALDVIFDKYVKPNLIQPTFVINPPKEISPLAKASEDNPDEAERFELVIAGMEVANAFSELTDPQEQKERFLQQAEERKKGDEESHVVDHDYIQALEYGLPPTGGDGIGIDRLVMIFTDRHSIREVILFPLLRPKEAKQ
ncbi:MAG: lysine--tRNA ligase [Candidatus Aminicenantes bacterium]|nr:lysine--tRNA ligase [Candidatus Aminicenantes bacterium]